MKHILEGSEFSDVSRIHTDRGSEFYNRLVKDYLKNKNMILYSVSSYEIKAAIAERVIRTLKNKIYRYLTSENTLKYIDVLPQIVKSYNSSPHGGLGNNLSPVEVHNFRDPNLIKKQFHYMYKDGIPKKKDRSIALAVDDSVRLSDSLRASKFKRGYDTQNTIEIFRIRSVDKSQNPTVYYLKDLADEDIDGVFYRDELTPTQIPDTFPIRILGKKKINGRIKYRVTWVGYPEKFITYVDASDVEKLKK